MESANTHNIDIRSRIPLYLAGFGASVMGMAALNVAIGDGELIVRMVLLLAIGFYTSWTARSRGVTRRAVHLATLIVLASILVIFLTFPTAKHLILPGDHSDSPELVLAVLLAWLMVLHSFNLISDSAVLFMCVPSLSLIGTIATFGHSELMTYFIAFLALANLILIFQNALPDSNRQAGSGEVVKLRAGSLRTRIGVALCVTVLAVGAGTIFGRVVYLPLENMLSFSTPPSISITSSTRMQSDDYVPIAAGPISLDEKIVMIVQSDEALLWRGITFDFYTGRGWANASLPVDDISIYPRMGEVQGDAGSRSRREDTTRVFNIPPDEDIKANAPFERIEQIFTYRAIGPRSVIHAAAEPETISFSTPNPLLRSRGGIRAADNPHPPGISYRVVSRVSTATPDQLRAAGDDYPRAVTDRYLGVPQSSWQIAGIVENITTAHSTAYDKAVAIQDYLEQNHTYDLKTAATPRNTDAVSHFILKSRRGYCDVFSSAMVIMSRQAGIPARWVTGFGSGEFNQQQGVFEVRTKDGHAWAELYFPGYGWITFDPTPSNETTHSTAYLLQQWDRVIGLFTAHKPSALAAVLILLLFMYLIKTELLGRVRAARYETSSTRTLATKSAEQYYIMCGVLSGFGYPRLPSVTPLEYAEDLRRLFGMELSHLSRITDDVTNSFLSWRYAGIEPSKEDIAWVSDEIHKLNKHLKTARRQHLLRQ